MTWRVSKWPEVWDDGNRELVIGHKARGFLALYQYVDEIDTVFVLAVRSQREAGYARTQF